MNNFLIAILLPILFAGGLLGYFSTFAPKPYDDYIPTYASNTLSSEKPSFWADMKKALEEKNEPWVDINRSATLEPKTMRNMLVFMMALATTTSNNPSPTELPADLEEIGDMTYILTTEVEQQFTKQSAKLFFFPPVAELPFKLTKIVIKSARNKSATIDGRIRNINDKLDEKTKIIDIQPDRVVVEVAGGKKMSLKISQK